MLSLFFATLGTTAEEVSETGLRTVFGEAAVKVVLVKDLPKIDGLLEDAPWQQAAELDLKYADERVEGTPGRGGWFKVVSDGANLYVAFHTEGGAGKGGGNKVAFLTGNFAGVVWKVAGAAEIHLAAINPEGETYFAKRKAADAPWEPMKIPNAVELAHKRTPKGWDIEWCLPLELFCDKDGGLPKLCRMDFLYRAVVGWTAGQTDLSRIRSFHAWKQRGVPAAEGLYRSASVFDDEDFGILYFAEGKYYPVAADEARLREASAQAAALEKIEMQKRAERGPGFEFSRDELERFFPTFPVLKVAKVKTAPLVDGDPNDEVWLAVEAVKLGFLSADIRGQPTRNRTWVRAVCDEEKIYFLYICEESNLEQIKATPNVKNHPDLWREDICDLFLDVGRQQDEALDGYAIFEINAAGSFTYGRKRTDSSWEPRDLAIKTRLWPEKKAWIMELAVAFADLGVEKENLPKVWGANFLRSRTPGRGDWINPAQTKDPAYLNFDFAWRGNKNAAAHRPDAFGVLYLEAGNALPAELHAALEKRDGPAAVEKLKRWVPPTEKNRPVLRSGGGEAKFAEKPKVLADKNGAVIEFEAAEATDVTVVIRNEQGRTVRHLAAGLLGKNAPHPLQSNKLKQKLTWDFTDDDGKPVPVGKYVASVGCGLTIERERHLLWNPNALSHVLGLAADAAGNVYVLQNDFNGSWHNAPLILVFDREGKYLRQVLPAAGALPKEKLTSAARIELPDGRVIPPVTHGTHQAFAPEQVTLSSARFAVTPSGKIVLLNGIMSTDSRLLLRLLVLGPDGAMEGDYAGPVLAPHARMRGQASIALSPDGRYAYLSGLNDGWAAYEGPDPRGRGLLTKHHAIYRLDLTERMKKDQPPTFPLPFLGKLGNPGEDDARFWLPLGVCTDKQGRLYVADCWNDRIMSFSPEGKLLGKMALPGVVQVEMDPKTDALYVLSSRKDKSVLAKYKNFQETHATHSLDLPAWTWAFMAADFSQPQPRFWLAGQDGPKKHGADVVIAADDLGDSFKHRGAVIADAVKDVPNRGRGLPTFIGAGVSPEGDKVAVGGWAVDAETGASLGGGQTLLRRGWDGRLYEKASGKERGTIRRFDEKGKALPFPAGVNGDLDVGKGGFSFAVDGRGRVFVLQNKSVRIYGPEGKLEKADHIVVPELPGTSDGVNGTICVDRQGAVYLAASMKPSDRELPEELYGRLPEVGLRPSLPFVYQHLYGSVVKFSPTGGRVDLDERGAWIWCKYYSGNARCKAEGVEWTHLGLSPLRIRNVEHIPCSCEHARFDVDAFGRVFLPDALRFQCEILDANGNRLLRFGRYGNMDDDVKFPGDPCQPALAWPINVDVRGDAVFVADKVNKRVVKLKLKRTVEEKLEIAVPEQ
jgi:hypothetical protein